MYGAKGSTSDWQRVVIRGFRLKSSYIFEGSSLDWALGGL